MKSCRFRICGMTLCALLTLARAAAAQETALSGVVTDATDAVLPGVTITALHTATGNTFVAVSDGSGNYRIGSMRVGVYRITAELAGFSTVTREGVQLLVGQNAVLNPQLTVSSVQESVTVTGAAPLVDTTGSKLGGNIDPMTMQAVPVNGRNWMALTMLAPGSRANDISNSPSSDQGASGNSISAVRSDPGYFQLIVDGFQVTQTMAGANFGEPKFARDAVGEFQFVSSRFDATQGRSIGVLLNAVTKSGTNLFSGSAYGYFRDDSMKGKDFVAGRVLPYSNQQIGGTFGGPLVLNKAHVFGYYEREREPTTFIFNSPYPSFNVPLSSLRLEQVAGVRLDTAITDRMRFMVRANGWLNELPIDPVRFNSGTIHPSGMSNRKYTNGQVFASLTQMLGQKSVNELRVGSFVTFSDQYVIDDKLFAAENIVLRGYTIGPSPSLPLRLNGHTWLVREDFSTVFDAKGKHEFKAGGDFLWNHDFYEWNTFRFGVLQANGGPVPANIEDLFPVWNDPSTWNLGALSPISVRYQRASTQYGKFSWVNKVPYAAGWAQDNWMLTPRLTLNLGLRWDLAYNWSANQWDYQPVRRRVANDWRNFGPRTGFAYALNDKTVIRGGWGVYYIGPKDQWAHHTPVNADLLVNVSVLNDGRPDFASNPFNGPIPPYEEAKKTRFDTVGYVASDLNQVPYSQQTSLGFQRQLGDSMSLQADYVFTASRREQALINTNLSYDPATGVNYPFTDISRRPWPERGIVQQIFAAGEADYHGLEAAFTRRFANRWQASATYTLSSFRDYYPQPWSGGAEVPFPVQPDLGNNWAYAEGHQRHRAVFNGVWELPADFQVSGLYFYGSGQRFASVCGCDARNSGNYGNRLMPDGTILPRNDVQGLPLHRMDLRVTKRLPLGNRVRVEGMFELFNVFNHANYGAYVTAATNARYRAPTQNVGVSYQPRMVQLGFRVPF